MWYTGGTLQSEVEAEKQKRSMTLTFKHLFWAMLSFASHIKLGICKASTFDLIIFHLKITCREILNKHM